MLDASEFARVIRPLLPQSAAYARSVLRNRHDAEDSVQQAALRAWERIAKFDGVRPFKGWWYAIVRNCCLDILRHRRRSPDTGSLDGIDVPDEVLAQTQDLQALQAALSRIAEAHQEILRLRYFGELSYEELAEALSIPKGTVMSRLHLARKSLADQMPQEEP